MTAPRRWLRLDVTWSSSSWLVVLRPGGRLAWVELLAYVKGSGIGGRVKALPVDAAARRWGIPRQDVSAMLQAAQTPHGDEDFGAIQVIDGDWVVTNWSVYQEVDMTAAERMRKHRALRRNGANSESENGARPPRNRVSRRNSRNVTRVPSRDSDVDLDVDSDRDRTARVDARAGSAAPEGGTPNAAPQWEPFVDWRPSEQQVARAAELHVADLSGEVRKFLAWRKANDRTDEHPGPGFDLWLERIPDFARNGNGARPDERPALPLARTSGFRPVDRDGREIDLETGLPVGDASRTPLAVVGGGTTKRGPLADAVAKILGPPVPEKLDDPEAIKRQEESRARLKAQAAALTGADKS